MISIILCLIGQNFLTIYTNLKSTKNYGIQYEVPAALTIYGPMQSTVLVSPSNMVKQRDDTGFLRTLLGNKLGNKFDYV